MSDEVKTESLVVYESPADIPITPDNERFKNGRLRKRVGRPKGPELIGEAIKQELGKDQNASKIARNIIKVARNDGGKYTNAAVAAAKECMDRTEGKAVQPMVVGMAHMDDATATRLIALAERLSLTGK